MSASSAPAVAQCIATNVCVPGAAPLSADGLIAWQSSTAVDAAIHALVASNPSAGALWTKTTASCCALDPWKTVDELLIPTG